MEKILQVFTGAFCDKDFYSKMLKLSLPVMAQNLIVSLLNMVDTIMVGNLGETEIAAVGTANQYFFFFHMFLIGLSAGCSVFIAQYWGKGDLKNIKRILGIGLISAITISLLFMFIGFINPELVIALFTNEKAVIELGSGYLKIVLFSYVFTGITFVYSFSLRSIGNATLPMFISGVALVFNVFFNYVFIFGNFGAPALGVEGAALATLISRVLETAVLLACIYGEKGILAASLKEMLDITYPYVKNAYRTIAPVIFNDLCWGLASLVYVAVYGRMGTQALAVIQICNTVSNLFMVVTFGLSNAAAVMIGNSIGSGEEGLSKVYAQRFSLIGVVVGIGLGMMLAVASPFILQMFNVSSTVRSSSQIILYMISLIFFIRVLAIMLIVGILRGGGDARQAFLIEGFTMWFIGVPLTLVGAFVFHFPVHVVYALALMEEVVKCFLSLKRLKSGKWINNLTEEMV